MFRKNNYIILGVSFIVFITILELFARFYLGLGDPPLYIEDKAFEYIYAPNQEVRRFGNSIITNEFSMRSKPLSDKDKIRIIKIGDSIINGGAQTDQDSLASSILEKELTNEFNQNVRVLNIGANSWGPDNAFAYIEKYGSFNASMIVMVFSSHDLHDLMHFQKVVGNLTAWPDKKPLCAISDGFFKYFVPWIRKKMDKKYDEFSEFGNIEVSKEVNPGWQSFFEYTKENNIQLLVYIHPTKEEVVDGIYNSDGKQLLKLLTENKIDYIQGLNSGMDVSCYRDYIHLNNKGQKKLANALKKSMFIHVKRKLKIEN